MDNSSKQLSVTRNADEQALQPIIVASPQDEQPSILRQTSMTAIISLIAGLSMFIGIPVAGSVIAIVTGNMALKEIRNSNGMVVGESYARIGLGLGWFGVLLWGSGIICVVCLLMSGTALGLAPAISSFFDALRELFRFGQQVTPPAQ